MQAKQRGTAKGENTEQREQENGAQRCPARSSQAAVAAVEWKLRVEAIPIASSPPARGAPARQRRRTLPDIHAPPEQARATSGPKIEVGRTPALSEEPLSQLTHRESSSLTTLWGKSPEMQSAFPSIPGKLLPLSTASRTTNGRMPCLSLFLRLRATSRQPALLPAASSAYRAKI